MDNNDYEEETYGEEVETDSSNGYSFPGFGTGNYYKENDIESNNESDLVNQNFISNPNQPDNKISPQSNPSSISSNNNNSSSPINSINDENNNSSNYDSINSSNKTQNNNINGNNINGNNINGNNINGNNINGNNINGNNKTSNNTNSNIKNNSSSTNKGLKSSDNNTNKSSNINNGKGFRFGNAMKNAGLRLFNTAKQNINNSIKSLESSTEGEESSDDNEVNNAITGLGKGLGKFTNLLMLLGGTKLVIIVVLFFVLVIILATFSSAIISILQGGVFSGTKFTGWQCNMYSPVSSSNPGEVSMFYTWRVWNNIPDAHTGIDISYNSKGEDILATHDGVVVETNYGSAGATEEDFGVYIKVEDPNETEDEKKYRTYYAHICSLEEEKILKESCENDAYIGCDDKCQEYIKPDGTIGHRYIWSCGENEQQFEELISKLHVGARVQKNDVLGYVSDTGSRSKACDFHLHYELQADNLNDNPDEGYVPESINRYFNIESSSNACDPVLNNKYDPPTIKDIIKWECEIHELVVEPDEENDKFNDEVFNYCPEEEPITPDEYRYKGEVNIKKSQSAINGEYTFEEGLGEYSSKICNYEANPSYMGQYKECAQGVRDYFASFLKDADPETWERFEEMRAKDSAKNYWYNNANMKENGFETSDTPSVGSIWVSEYDVHGHVMVITEMNETGVVAYECNQKGPGGSLAANICQYRNYTYSELENKHKSTFLGYIKIIDGEDC